LPAATSQILEYKHLREVVEVRLIVPPLTSVVLVIEAYSKQSCLMGVIEQLFDSHNQVTDWRGVQDRAQFAQVCSDLV
jgi:hypothetical protein